MQNTYSNPIYAYKRSSDMQAGKVVHHPVIIVGAGPGGLAMAVDFALQGIPAVVLDDNNTVSVGSRAICFAKRTLEVMNRLGCAKRMLDKGITWQHGKVFLKDELVYDFNLLPESDHEFPAFINLQQYYFEEYLVDRTRDFKTIDLRWKSKVTALKTSKEKTLVTVQTPDGEYELSCDFLLSADGSRSPIRKMLGLESKGQVFQDRFLIADVVMKADFPTERWFWFDPPFHQDQSALLHKQPDNVWRIDLQLGWDADPEHEQKEEVIRPRIQAMLGDNVDFDLEWASVYTFQCRKMDSFIHNRVIFVGDAAHQVSPFGARGANGCIQSAENAVWKIARIIKGEAPLALLDTYDVERQHGAKENILNSTRATDFITPKTAISRVFRDQTLKLAKHYPFARSLVNSGRLSVPCSTPFSPLNSEADMTINSEMLPGMVPKDAPIFIANRPSWFLHHLGNSFVLLYHLSSDVEKDKQLIEELSGEPDMKVILLADGPVDSKIDVSEANILHDKDAVLTQRYGIEEAVAYLFRPDQIITARWRRPTPKDVKIAKNRALGFDLVSAIENASGAA